MCYSQHVKEKYNNYYIIEVELSCWFSIFVSDVVRRTVSMVPYVELSHKKKQISKNMLMVMLLISQVDKDYGLV